MSSTISRNGAVSDLKPLICKPLDEKNIVADTRIKASTGFQLYRSMNNSLLSFSSPSTNISILGLVCL